MEDIIRLEVESGEAGKRLDTFIAEKLKDLTRSKATRLIKEGNVLLNGKSELSPNHKTREGNFYAITLPEPEPLEAMPENIPIEIVYEDSDIAIINKEPGIVVHPAKGNHTGTLVNAVLYHCKDLSGIGGKLRPGIVHRLDKDTSGLIAIAKNDEAHNSLSKQLASREMGREYLAIARGKFSQTEGSIEKPIGRHPQFRKKMSVNTKMPRDAKTDFTVLEQFKDTAYIRLKLHTGRTHQIRVHLSSINHPILGDMVYGKRKTNMISRPALHAATLTLIHPKTGKETRFNAEPPEDFKKLLEALRKSG